MREKMPDMVFKKRKEVRKKDSVYFWDRGSFTIMKVEAIDRNGLLFIIALTFYASGVNLNSADIRTEGLQVGDVFYLQKDGNVLSLGTKRALKEELKELLGQRELTLDKLLWALKI
jgi:UTP:GlnB (protein PII) uridylyltransferase